MEALGISRYEGIDADSLGLFLIPDGDVFDITYSFKTTILQPGSVSIEVFSTTFDDASLKEVDRHVRINNPNFLTLASNIPNLAKFRLEGVVVPAGDKKPRLLGKKQRHESILTCVRMIVTMLDGVEEEVHAFEAAQFASYLGLMAPIMIPAAMVLVDAVKHEDWLAVEQILDRYRSLPDPYVNELKPANVRLISRGECYWSLDL